MDDPASMAAAYRRRAAHLHAIAGCADVKTRLRLLDIVRNYERMAQAVIERGRIEA
jgi:hypothetical protein